MENAPSLKDSRWVKHDFYSTPTYFGSTGVPNTYKRSFLDKGLFVSLTYYSYDRRQAPTDILKWSIVPDVTGASVLSGHTIVGDTFVSDGHIEGSGYVASKEMLKQNQYYYDYESSVASQCQHIGLSEEDAKLLESELLSTLAMDALAELGNNNK